MVTPCRAALLCALWLAGPTMAHADFNSSELEFDKGLHVTALGGYPRSQGSPNTSLTLGFQIDNRGPERTLEVALKGSLGMRRRLRVAGGEQRRVFFYLPTSTDHYYGRTAVQLHDTLTDKLLVAQLTFDHAGDKATVARLGDLSLAFNVSKPWSFVGPLDGHMPDSWRGLSGIHAIVVEYDRLQREARWHGVLGEWLATGGVLLVATPDDSIDGSEDPLPSAPLAGPWQTGPNGRYRDAGLGWLVLIRPGALADMNGSLLEDTGLPTPSRWFGSSPTYEPSNMASFLQGALPGVAGEPSWALFSVLVVFALVVGPLGFRHWVTKRGRPFAYVGFASGCALMFGLGLLVADLADRGLQPIGHMRSMLVVDQVSRTQFGLAAWSLYASTSLGTTIEATEDSELVVPWVGHNEGSRYLSSLRAGTQLLEGAIPVRRRKLVGNRWVLPMEGRLDIRTKGGQLRVENHLGSDLSDLVLWLDDYPFHLKSLAAGAAGMAAPIKPEEAESLSHGGFGGPLASDGNQLLDAVQSGRLGGHRYVGRIASAPSQALRFDAEPTPLSQGEHVVAGVFQ